MITYFVGVEEIVSVEAPLIDKDLSARVAEGPKEF